MSSVNISDIKARFSYYADLVMSGEKVVISKRNKPFAVLMPYPDSFESSDITFGVMEGKFKVADDFNDSIEEFESSYYS